MHRRTAIAPAAVVALSGAAPAVAAAPKPKQVEVADNYFLPDALTVKPDTVSTGSGRTTSPSTSTTRSSSPRPRA